jgi:hypothetical protein
MTLRSIAWMRRNIAALGVSALVGTFALMLSGCDPRQALYFLQPFEPTVAAPCPSLKGKRVVVITSAVAGTQNEYVGIDREITSSLVKTLRKSAKKIDVVDPDKVYDWTRNKPSMTDPADAAKAFEADVVIFLEIQKFQVQDPRDLAMYQGKSLIHIQVTELEYQTDDRDRPLKDKPKESKVVFENDLDTEFPITGGVPIDSGTSKSSFKNRFMKVVNEQLSWNFIDHAPGDNIQDTKFMER